MSDLVSSVLGTILALVVRSVWSKLSGLLAMLSRRLPRAAPVDCNYKKKGDEASSREVRYYVSGVDGDVLTEEGRSVGGDGGDFFTHPTSARQGRHRSDLYYRKARLDDRGRQM